MIHVFTKPSLVFLFAVLGISLSAFAAAGEKDSEPTVNAGDWCNILKNKPGKLYENPENPIIQYFRIGGRFQYQVSHVDGNDVNGRDFNDSYDEFRRVRLESETKLLQYFSVIAKINIVSDSRFSGGDLAWGYDTFDEAILSFDIAKAFGAGPLDELRLNYGRFKFNMTEEVRMSANKIYTIERSAIANKLYGSPNRATGVTVDAAMGKWSGTVGIFSGEDDSDFIGGWSDGIGYYLSVAHETTDEWRFLVDLLINDESGTDDRFGYGWATALNAIYNKDHFGAVTTVVAGRNNDAGVRGGSFHGLVIMPWYWIVEEKLQAVVQYQYAGAEESEGIRTNARYFRAQHSPGVDVNGGRGDTLHTLYSGLNYYFCGHNLKIMTGIEYSSLNTPVGDVNALTYMMAFRTYF